MMDIRLARLARIWGRPGFNPGAVSNLIKDLDDEIHAVHNGERTTMGQYTLRVPPDLLERADRLADWISEKPDYAAIHGGSGLSRSAILRLALLHGLERFEHDHFLAGIGDDSLPEAQPKYINLDEH